MARYGSKKGAALLLVITVVGLLTFLTVEFMRSSHLEVVSATNLHSSLQAQALVRSGVTAAQVLLNEDDQAIDSRDSTQDYWYGDPRVVPIGEFAIELKIEDNMGKFPVNYLVYGNNSTGQTPGAPNPAMMDGYERLLLALALDLPTGVSEDDLVEALTDWIDEDNTSNRFEFNDNFTVPNTYITHLDELARITGYDELDQETLDLITDHLDTRWDPAPNPPQININTAEVPVLMSLHAGVLQDDMQTLYDELTDNPDNTPGPTTNKYIPQVDRTMTVVFKSTRFFVKVKAEASGVYRQVECILERKSGGAGGPARAVPIDWTQY